MTGAEVALIITAIGTLLTAMATAASIVMQEMNRRETSRRLQGLHEQGNSNLQQMQRIARAAGIAEGNLQGRAEQTAEREAEEKQP